MWSTFKKSHNDENQNHVCCYRYPIRYHTAVEKGAYAGKLKPV